MQFIADEVQTHAAMRSETRYGNQPGTVEIRQNRQRLTIRFRLASADLNSRPEIRAGSAYLAGAELNFRANRGHGGPVNKRR